MAPKRKSQAMLPSCDLKRTGAKAPESAASQASLAPPNSLPKRRRCRAKVPEVLSELATYPEVPANDAKAVSKLLKDMQSVQKRLLAMEFLNETLMKEVQSLRTLHAHEQAERRKCYCYGRDAFRSAMVAEHKIELERSETAELRQRVEELEELLAETRTACAVAPTVPAEDVEYVVQRCTPEFAERLSELQAEFVADHQALLGIQEAEDIFMLLGIAEHPQYRKLRATRLLGEASDKEVLGIFKQNNLLGYVQLSFQKDCLMIDYLKVDRAHQRQGLASRLLQAAENTCRGRGRMKIQVLDCNGAAIQLYERHGFKRRSCSPAVVDMLNLGKWIEFDRPLEIAKP